ncbi:hypothetical protein GE21DRAFT_879 [Neurospora crassa]|uniref:Uncharacterized protein n=1 Tax=Neurospora crassa (strain ATCC 24698 / 74-OR23-1A / CBS 708.71 / DSM 1257 / FGSC 987) TaxID=367110 RepID=Q7SH43_NEUCR|nr:hypothetical protein NCU02686 [Neurospora crassa OR74A]EAA36223.1 hypothetical protein NCU02686 [Neurospora crassa OR74A]KHE90135.1 hypothetical protein GE21DRAFT_879 [Neurospora crassa]|eukprot:XP_965459.1 hypothetical protein NCU02686 [Neurospora crassa OR74A]
MDSFRETLEAVQKVLQPYTRPREEAAHIRRILTLHLSSGLKDGATLTEPLSLTESSEVPSYSQDTREIQSNYLLNHLTNLKIQKKQEKLLVVKKNLDLLRQKPAASPDFLDHQKLFRVCRPLPEVPTEIINSLALEETSENITASSSVRLEDLEETLLENAKSHPFTVQPDEINPEAKLQALNATRTELINWVETELGKASGEEKDGGGERAGQDDFQVQRDQQLAHKTQLLKQQLTSIKEKYAEYLSMRKALLELVTTQLRSLPSLDFPAITAFSSSPSAASPERSSTQAVAAAAAAEASTPAPIIDHLLTPTLTRLLTLSHEHKGLMAHKAHVTTLLTKQLRENAQVLDHLVEESQLIPAHATAVVVQKKKQDDDPNAMMSSRLVNPWVSAADSAKIATFEVVVEKIEKGQIALEGAIRMLGEADRLLGRGLQQQQQQQRQQPVKAACGEEEGNDDDNDGDDDEVGEESDIWLVEGQKSLKITNATGGSGLGTRYDEGGRKGKETIGHREGGSLSMWNMVDVHVGLEKSG